MRRKIRALASEGRASAMILSSLADPDVFSSSRSSRRTSMPGVWNEDLTKICLAGAAGWMGIGNLIMFRMVNFKI